MLRNWGSTPDEIASALPGDELCPGARIVATRSISLASPPEQVFPWLRQMGFGRAGWYSYDLLDNLGRRSARAIVDEWQDVSAGDSIPGGPVGFEATIVDPPHSFVLRLAARGRVGRRIDFTLAYDLRPVEGGTRLVTRARAKIDVPGGVLLERVILEPGDGIMVRKQLLGLARRLGPNAGTG
ncbi:MAG: hypothetical protein ACOYMR_12655 [Ilumatobacteraceae bacterium]